MQRVNFISFLCYNLTCMNKNKNDGFTLLELLIVIAIIAILSVALVLVLNPAETLKKARDSQRISDLSTIKTAIGLYLTTVSPAYLGGISDNNLCKATVFSSAGNTTPWSGSARISYSVPSSLIFQVSGLDGGASGPRASVVNPSITDGNGWVPVNFNNITGGSPISNLPLDPINSVTSGTSTASTINSSALVYRYGCAVSPFSYEIDAQLESTAYTVNDNKLTSDGGNSISYYESGTNLFILGITSGGTDADNINY